MDLTRYFATWDGSLSGHDARLQICVLIFLICESLRFRSIENVCARYIWPIGGMPADPTARPILAITGAMLDTVQNGRTRAIAHDPDVLTYPPGMVDPFMS